MLQSLDRLFTDDSGQDLADYAVLIALIAIGLFLAFQLIEVLIEADEAGRSFPSNRRP